MDWDFIELINDKDAEILELKDQNESLKTELDKQIKDNRKLVKALKEIANTETCTEEYGLKCAYEFHTLAKITLNEIGEE